MPIADEREDVHLLDRLVARNAEALGELYDRHSRVMFGLILRILGDRDEAEEVLQDVFVRIWNRTETFTSGLGTPGQWLVRIARNRAIDRLRANTSGFRTLELTFPLSRAPHTPQSEQQRALARALEGLGAEERQLLEHAYFLGLTQTELAERFNLPVATVKTSIRTALSTLGRALRQTIGDAPG